MMLGKSLLNLIEQDGEQVDPMHLLGGDVFVFDRHVYVWAEEYESAGDRAIAWRAKDGRRLSINLAEISQVRRLPAYLTLAP